MDKPKSYFEGVLQLRNPTEEIINFVADQIDANDKVWIAKTVRQKNGIDLYLSSNKFLKQIGTKLQQRFTGGITLSKRIFTRSHLTGKEVYRGCVCFRHFDFKKGDTIVYKGDKIEVMAIGKEILGKNKETNRKVHIKFKDLG